MFRHFRCHEELMEELGEFDLVYSTLAMHHWKDPEKVIGNLLKVVGAGGVLFIHDLRRVWWLYYLPLHDSWIHRLDQGCVYAR
ncbi:MAG: methyltransferase domain-containing protein [Euryarchaeota archaeon]|nr:methyltransferase domain-containing protein [Euryarchaeota archaeon]